MYLRPMLGVGKRCRLAEACREHGIAHEDRHIAAIDAMSSGALLNRCLDEASARGLWTFRDLARLKSYKFVESWDADPYDTPDSYRLPVARRYMSRYHGAAEPSASMPTPNPLAAYWDVIKTVVADLAVTSDELDYAVAERTRLGLTVEQIRSVHARAFASVIGAFIEDRQIDDREELKLRKLYACLSRLGWAPGE